MTTLYVFDLDGGHVATICGDDNEGCESAYMRHYDINDYVAAYTPAFGFGGAVENAEAAIIDVSEEQ